MKILKFFKRLFVKDSKKYKPGSLVERMKGTANRYPGWLLDLKLVSDEESTTRVEEVKELKAFIKDDQLVVKMEKRGRLTEIN